jgi:hypothetical protein
MTAVAGLVHNGRVHLGADSAGVSGWLLSVRADEKVFTNGPYAMGFTDSFRMGQLLRYRLDPPKPATGPDLHRFMATDFVDAVRECLKNGGFATRNNEQESGGTFLVGVRGRLFTVHRDYQVAENAGDIAAIGCGNELCLGALYASGGWESPRERLRTALAAAERFSAGVRGPFAYASTRSSR